MTAQTITQAELKRLLNYDPITGVFVWRVARKDRIGKSAGSLNTNGHRQLKINDKHYMAHRLAWLYMRGEMPTVEIDHINGNKDDNSIDNLRLASHKQNMENVKLRINNKSGFRGVSWHKATGKWRARVEHHGKSCSLGLFNNIEDAVVAVRSARDLLFTHHKTTHSA